MPSRCYRCRTITDLYQVCQACRSRSAIDRVWVVTNYDGLAKRLVQVLKFNRAKAGATDIAEMLASLLAGQTIRYLIVPVPTTNLRRRQRGYDQAVEIARHLARLTGKTFINVLSRTGTARQVGAKRAARLQQLSGVFEAGRFAFSPLQAVLLVDDVLTTGATLEEAARTLKAEGYERVEAIVFAQA